MKRYRTKFLNQFSKNITFTPMYYDLKDLKSLNSLKSSKYSSLTSPSFKISSKVSSNSSKHSSYKTKELISESFKDSSITNYKINNKVYPK